MPILMMALLALIIFGTIGILLVVAVIMEQSPGEHPARRHCSPGTSDVAPSLPNFDRARGDSGSTENPSTEEKVHEHAYVG